MRCLDGITDSMAMSLIKLQELVKLGVLLSMGFSRQEYGSGLPFPSPGDLPNPGMKPALQADSLLFKPPGKHFHFLSDHMALKKGVLFCLSVQLLSRVRLFATP